MVFHKKNVFSPDFSQGSDKTRTVIHRRLSSQFLLATVFGESGSSIVIVVIL